MHLEDIATAKSGLNLFACRFHPEEAAPSFYESKVIYYLKMCECSDITVINESRKK